MIAYTLKIITDAPALPWPVTGRQGWYCTELVANGSSFCLLFLSRKRRGRRGCTASDQIPCTGRLIRRGDLWSPACHGPLPGGRVGTAQSRWRMEVRCLLFFQEKEGADWYIRFMVKASSAWVPALSQIKVGLQPRRATSSISGTGSGPNSSWSKVRCIFSPPLGVN